MGSITPWLTTTEADTYMESRYGASTLWATGIEKEAILLLAQTDIQTCGRYDFDHITEDGTDPTDAEQEAVCEQALFILQNPDMDSRMALIAQGVSTAWVILEGYTRATNQIVIAPRVDGLLASSRTGGSFSITK